MTSPKRLVVFNQSAGYLMVDIINANSSGYEEVILITGNYNPRQTPLRANVKIKKTIRYNRSSSLKRLFTWGISFLQMYLYAVKYQRGSHFLLVSNPPLAFFVPLKKVASYSLLVYDVYPNALVDYKYLQSSSVLVKIWKRLNIRVYRKAKAIFTISEGMKSLLLEYVGGERIKVVPVWTDNQFLKPVCKSENIFLKKHNLRDKFIVQYSGNLGKTHNVEVLIEIAKRIFNSRIHFLIIGEGTQKSVIEKRVMDSQLENVTVLPWQETMMLPFSLSAADIGFVSLDAGASTLSVPSKTFNLMSVGVPILCIANELSELARLIGKYDFGKCFQPTAIDDMTEFIMELFANPERREHYGANSLKASHDFTSLNANLIR